MTTSPMKNVSKERGPNEDEIKKKHSDYDLNTHPEILSGGEGKPLISGLVQKKCGWIFYKPRHMVLSDNKIITYYEPQSNSEMLLKVFLI